jgi:hypothetical protein
MAHMRRTVPVVIALGLLAACSSSHSVQTQRYYDPSGLFSARLPAAQQLITIPRQDVSTTITVLSGVMAIPPTDTPSPSAAIGGGLATSAAKHEDAADYTVWAVKAGDAKDLRELASQLLGQTTNPTLKSQRRVIVEGLQGILVVADHRTDAGDKYYTDASAFFLYRGVGYWVREIFPFGDWKARRAVFSDLLRSFRPVVPAGIPAVPLTRPGLHIESKLGWPLG